MLVEDSEMKQSVTCGAEDSIVFPFGLCEMDGEVYFFDYSKHCIYEITFSGKRVTLALGKEDETGNLMVPATLPGLIFSSCKNCKKCVSLCCGTPLNNSRSCGNGLFLKVLTRCQYAWRDISDESEREWFQTEFEPVITRHS